MPSSSGTSESWSRPNDLLDEPTRDRAPRTSDGGDDGDDDVSAERVASRLRKPGALRALCKRYAIPGGFAPVLAGGRSSCSTPPPGSVCVYLDALDAGMRLPLHPFFAAVLTHFGLAPGQLSPNGWRAMAGFVALSRSAGVDPSLAVFRHFFALCPFPPHGFYTLRGKDADGLLFARIRAKFVKGWKEDFFFLASSAPWPCPVEWGEPSRSSTFDPSLTVQEKAVADSLLRARGSSPIDLFAYLHHRNMGAASITGVSPPTPRAVRSDAAMEEATTAAARATAGKVTVKSEPDCKVPPCAPSLGKKRKLPEDRADGESSASGPSCPPGFSAPCKSPPATSKDGDWKAARRLLQGTVTPSRERELAASKPADVVASTYVSLLQTANEVAFSLGYALELEEKLRARERKADALQGELHRKLKARETETEALRAELRKAKAELDETAKAAAAREELWRKMKARERDTAEAEALRAELRKAKAVLAEAKADAGIAAAAARGLREELDRNVKARERDAAETDALRAELHKAKAELAATKAEAERAAPARWFWGSSREHARALAERELRGYERGLEDMRRAALHRYPYLDPALLFVPVRAPP
ncbi:uncharacterized protein LOC125521542 isoform X1 [Triticum urartu]|uniref:uncharacterized protein LOC125521542 isoform X1 n=1 Tax=Triticum urartu TaxID=4572 RepID=UPI002044C125|nr:uncharacterized protein LOC125521542 isoform X1 [Triticum urartu]